MSTTNNPKCFPLVAGCCATGKCTNKEGSCGSCIDKCNCPKDSICRRDDIRKKPELDNGSSGLLFAGALVVLAAAGAAAYFMKIKD